MEKVRSTNIARVGYDAQSKTLAVEFRNGSIYHYHGIDQDKHDEFMRAESKGKYLHQHIKGRYTVQRYV